MTQEPATVLPEAAMPTGRAVKSADRTLEILEVLGGARGPVNVTQMHSITGYPRSSLHQLLHTMAAKRWIEFSEDGSTVAIGTRALLVGTSYLDRDGALVHAGRSLEKIRDATGYTTHFARREGSHVVYLATRETAESHRATSRVGRQLPANATALGKALLAELSSAEVESVMAETGLVKLTDRTITTMPDLERELESTRQRGYSLETEENTVGVACVAVAIPYRIPASDAISCSVPLDHADADELARVGEIIVAESTALAAVLRARGIR